MLDWVGILEVWTWTYYSAQANTQMGLKMHQNTHFQTQNRTNGGTIPYKGNSPDGKALKGTRLPIISAPAVPLFLCLWRLTCPPNPNPVSAPTWVALGWVRNFKISDGLSLVGSSSKIFKTKIVHNIAVTDITSRQSAKWKQSS